MKTMKKLLIAIILIALVGITITSCSSSRRSKTGCPMTENIIH